MRILAMRLHGGDGAVQLLAWVSISTQHALLPVRVLRNPRDRGLPRIWVRDAVNGLGNRSSVGQPRDGVDNIVSLVDGDGFMLHAQMDRYRVGQNDATAWLAHNGPNMGNFFEQIAECIVHRVMLCLFASYLVSAGWLTCPLYPSPYGPNAALLY
jgi:hypothetical protein